MISPRVALRSATVPAQQRPAVRLVSSPDPTLPGSRPCRRDCDAERRRNWIHALGSPPQFRGVMLSKSGGISMIMFDGHLFPDESQPTTYQRLEAIESFWNQCDVDCDNSGETALRGLEGERDLVMSLLRQVPPDLIGAEAMTAYAALLMTGCGPL